RYVRPRLVSRLTGEKFGSILPLTYIRDRICSEKNAEKMRTMLTSVVHGEHGTGKRLKNDYVRIAGKTGTCYMIEGGHYNNAKKRLAFCGFFPAENPKYSCIVLTCNPKQNALGAASTSGEVLKNIALKLYSRGMLDNSSDYRAEPAKNDPPVLYATADIEKAKKVGSALTGGGQHRSIQRHTSSSKGVPSVVGLGLRDAIAALESSGYNVRFKGSGYVAAQTPAAGTEAARGTSVTLSLRE
ncbi:MAG: PASTA domain-containing protein, partial [Paramuribaculum sp.]|nr:PASTA domain-containing protein [Paramuribaculum sp.]